VKIFLGKYFSNDKTMKLENGIGHFVQLEKKSFGSALKDLNSCLLNVLIMV